MSQKSLGAVIRSTRKGQGHTQIALAAGAKVSQAMVSKIEAGQLSVGLGSFIKICDFLGIGYFEAIREWKGK